MKRLLLALPLLCSCLDEFEDEICELAYIGAEPVVAEAWEHEWPRLAPIWETAAGFPEDDQKFCQAILDELGVEVVYKPKGVRANTAFFTHVWLNHDFENYSEARQASILCHETMHILWQHRVGVERASTTYALPHGKMAIEGTATALQDAIMERHGAGGESLASRARRFPETYFSNLDGTCVEVAWLGYRDELQLKIDAIVPTENP